MMHGPMFWSTGPLVEETTAGYSIAGIGVNSKLHDLSQRLLCLVSWWSAVLEGLDISRAILHLLNARRPLG